MTFLKRWKEIYIFRSVNHVDQILVVPRFDDFRNFLDKLITHSSKSLFQPGTLSLNMLNVRTSNNSPLRENVKMFDRFSVRIPIKNALADSFSAAFVCSSRRFSSIAI